MRIPFLKREDVLPPLEDEECERMLAAANSKLRLALLVGLNSGISQSELLSLRKSDLDMAARTMYVPLKSGAVRRVVLPYPTMQKLNDYAYQQDGLYLFDFPAGSMTKLISDVGVRCGIKLSWQRIRSTYIRNAAKAGVPILTCAHNVGTNPANIKHYYVLTPEQERFLIDKISD